MEAWNRAIFLTVNASPHASPVLITLATVLARWAIFIAPVLLAALWLWGDGRNRTGLLLAFCAAELALGFNQLIALVWYHPRPFAVHIGRTLIEHAADSSFPSDHVTFLVTIGLGLLVWTCHRWAGISVLALAVFVAWARLFLGVHFPIDMLGAVLVGILGIVLLAPFRGWARRALMLHLLEPLYRRIFAAPIKRGWVRP